MTNYEKYKKTYIFFSQEETKNMRREKLKLQKNKQTNMRDNKVVTQWILKSI